MAHFFSLTPSVPPAAREGGARENIALTTLSPRLLITPYTHTHTDTDTDRHTEMNKQTHKQPMDMHQLGDFLSKPHNKKNKKPILTLLRAYLDR
jgi:hypothetical protein